MLPHRYPFLLVGGIIVVFLASVDMAKLRRCTVAEAELMRKLQDKEQSPAVIPIEAPAAPVT